jgi:hypothetical protein
MSVPKNKFQLEFLSRMNVIYHENRELHFVRLIRWSTFCTLVLGSATVASLSDLAPKALEGSGKQLGIAFALIVSLLSAATLAFDWFGCLAMHSRFKGKWTALLVEAALLDESNSAGFQVLVRKLQELNADEPPPNANALSKANLQARSAMLPAGSLSRPAH